MAIKRITAHEIAPNVKFIFGYRRLTALTVGPWVEKHDILRTWEMTVECVDDRGNLCTVEVPNTVFGISTWV